MARLYFEEADYEQAFSHYEKALALLPGHYFANVRAGLCLLRQDKHEESRSFFEAAGALRPDEWVPPYNLACVSALQGQPQAAFGHLATALTKKPDPRLFLSIMEDDEDLASLREIEGYGSLLESLRREAGVPPPEGAALP